MIPKFLELSNHVSLNFLLGTGKWTAISALEYGMPVTLIGESIFARCLSSLKSERVKASEVLKGPEVTTYDGDKKVFFLTSFS